MPLFHNAGASQPFLLQQKVRISPVADNSVFGSNLRLRASPAGQSDPLIASDLAARLISPSY
jgi:hypothetical protein